MKELTKITKTTQCIIELFADNCYKQNFLDTSTITSAGLLWTQANFPNNSLTLSPVVSSQLTTHPRTCGSSIYLLILSNNWYVLLLPGLLSMTYRLMTQRQSSRIISQSQAPDGLLRQFYFLLLHFPSVNRKKRNRLQKLFSLWQMSTNFKLGLLNQVLAETECVNLGEKVNI